MGYLSYSGLYYWTYVDRGGHEKMPEFSGRLLWITPNAT